MKGNIDTQGYHSNLNQTTLYKLAGFSCKLHNIIPRPDGEFLERNFCILCWALIFRVLVTNGAKIWN